jgi:hypothetical protein
MGYTLAGTLLVIFVLEYWSASCKKRSFISVALAMHW